MKLLLMSLLGFTFSFGLTKFFLSLIGPPIIWILSVIYIISALFLIKFRNKFGILQENYEELFVIMKSVLISLEEGIVISFLWRNFENNYSVFIEDSLLIHYYGSKRRTVTIPLIGRVI